MQIKLLRIREASSERALSPREVADIMAEEAKADRECFWVLHLNTKLYVIEKELVAIGSLGEATVAPREIFKKAILNSAFGIITVHNHPAGSLEPSESDKKVWERLIKCGELLGIGVTDNMIVTPAGKYYSLQESEPYNNVL